MHERARRRPETGIVASYLRELRRQAAERPVKPRAVRAAAPAPRAPGPRRVPQR